MRIAIGHAIKEFEDENLNAAWKFILDNLRSIGSDAGIVIENQYGESHGMIVDAVMFEALCENPTVMKSFLETFGYGNDDT